MLRRRVPVALSVASLVALYACVGSDPADAEGGEGPDGGAPVDQGGERDASAVDVAADGPQESCTPDLFCQPANACKKGVTVCGATAVCEEREDVAYGIACGTSPSTICVAGACEDTNWALWTMPSWNGAAVGPVPSYSFESSSAGETSVDSVTKLLWTRDGPSAQTWTQAKAHCDGYSMYGFTDWRLPTAIEVVSIGDVSQASGFAQKFGAIVDGMWSSTPVAGSPGSHWSVSALRVRASADSETFEVRCVR